MHKNVAECVFLRKTQEPARAFLSPCVSIESKIDDRRNEMLSTNFKVDYYFSKTYTSDYIPPEAESYRWSSGSEDTQLLLTVFKVLP